LKYVHAIRNIEDIDNIQRHLKSHSERNYLLFTMGISTGLRVSDLVNLRVGDIKKPRIDIKEVKTRKTKRLLLQPWLREEFKNFIEGRKDDHYLFQSRKGDNRPLQRAAVYKFLSASAKKCGIHSIGTHSMRKTFGYWTYSKNKQNIGLVMEMLNHSKEGHTLRYIGITQDDEDKARLKLKFC
jgi:integrase